MFSEQKYFVMTLVLLIRFVSASSCKWHALSVYSIYSIEENDISWENLYYIIWCLKRNNFVAKTIFIVCLLL